MSEHRAHRRGRRLGSGRVRAVLSLGIVVGLGSVSTMAFWTDDATMTTGSFESGRLDVALDGNLGNQIGGTWNNATFAAPNLVPGESVARTVPVQNVGSTAFTYTAAATATGALATGVGLTPTPTAAERLQFAVHLNSTATNSGTAAANTRSGTCSGTAASSGPLGATSTAVVPTPQTIAAAGTQNVCIRVSLPTGAPNALQSQTSSATFVFSAKQVGAP